MFTSGLSHLAGDASLLVRPTVRRLWDLTEPCLRLRRQHTVTRASGDPARMGDEQDVGCDIGDCTVVGCP